MRNRRKDGVILITVMWVVIILALIAWGLGRRSALEASILDTYEGKLRSYAAARGGLNYTMRQMEKTPSQRDTLYSVGIKLDKGQKPEDVFGRIDTGGGTYAAVSWTTEKYETSGKGKTVFGLEDEQGKININNIDQNNYTILSMLFERKGLKSGDALELARAIVGYKGTGMTPDKGQRFLEDDDKGALKPKAQPFDHLYELMDIPGMTPELFAKIKDDLTVYGDPAKGLAVNVRTVNNDVLEALAEASVQLVPTANKSDVVSRALSMRDGSDGIPFTEDDGAEPGPGDQSVPPAGWPAALQDTNTNFVRIRVTGVDVRTKARTSIYAIVRINGGFAPNDIVGWGRE